MLYTAFIIVMTINAFFKCCGFKTGSKHGILSKKDGVFQWGGGGDLYTEASVSKF